MKQLSIIFVAVVLACGIQVAQAQSSYEEYARKRKAGYEAYKTQKTEGIKRYNEEKNREYARRMSERWEYHQLSKGIMPPPSPDPVTPPEVVPDTPPTPPKEVAPEDTPMVIPEPTPAPQEEITPPVVEPKSEQKYVYANYYGSKIRIAYTPAMVRRMTDCNESGVAAAWSHLSEGSSNLWLKELFNLRKELSLCDWAYYKLVEKASVALLGDGNDATLLQVFTLVQSGLKVRMGHEDGNLRLLYPSTMNIYGYSYLPIDGMKYFVMTDGQVGGLFIYDSIFPGEQLPSAQITIPLLANTPTPKQPHAAKKYPNVAVVAGTNFNVIDYYNECPRNTSWQYYANANLSEGLKEQVYPTLRREIEGLSAKDAANVLINFVQTGFEYKTDDAQFGYERPLYGDEMFYYAFSDCEDRSILYSILVRDLLGLDVVLLHFQNHLATAVHFPSEVEGDYLMVGGKKYIICDPTYINASIGMTMPSVEGKLQNIIALN